MFEAFDPSGEVDLDLYYTKVESDSKYQPISGMSSYLTVASAENLYQPKGNYLTEHQSLENYYTKSEADNKFLTSHQDLSGYALKSEIPDVSNFVTSAFTDATYAKKGEVPSIDTYTKSEADEKFQAQSGMTDYALKSELPSTTGLASEEWVSNNFSSTAHTHSEYAEKTDLANYMPNSGMTDYALKSEIPNSYTKTEADNLLAGKANSAHTHTMSEITDLDVPKTWRGTLAQYNNLTEIDNDTLYIITDSSEQLVTSGDVESMISGYTNLTEVETLLEGYSQTGHTHDYETLTNKPDLSIYLTEHQDISGLATKQELENYMPNSGMTDYVTDSELNTALEGKSNTGHTHSYNDLEDKPTIPSIAGLASETWVSQNFQPQSAMTEYSLSGHTHSQYLTQTSADTRYARVVSLTQAQYDALVQNDQVEQGVLYCIIEQSNS